MRIPALVAVLLSAAYASCFALPSTQIGLRICNNDFTLGMSKAVAIAGASIGDCQIAVDSSNNPSKPVVDFPISSRANPLVLYGALRFKGDKLQMITRNWEATVHDDKSYAETIVGLFHNLEVEGNTSCKMKTYQQSEPGVSAKDVSFICGSREILIGLIEDTNGKAITIQEIIRMSDEAGS